MNDSPTLSCQQICAIHIAIISTFFQKVAFSICKYVIS